MTIWNYLNAIITYVVAFSCLIPIQDIDLTFLSAHFSNINFQNCGPTWIWNILYVLKLTHKQNSVTLISFSPKSFLRSNSCISPYWISLVTLQHSCINFIHEYFQSFILVVIRGHGDYMVHINIICYYLYML